MPKLRYLSTKSAVLNSLVTELLIVAGLILYLVVKTEYVEAAHPRHNPNWYSNLADSKRGLTTVPVPSLRSSPTGATSIPL